MHLDAEGSSIPSRRTSPSGRPRRRFVLVAIAAGLLIASGARLHHPVSVLAAFHKVNVAGNQDWAAYNGGVDGDHYSNLNQINRNTVAQLKIAWVLDLHEKGGLQTNPLIIGLTLYGYTAKQSVIAVNAATGARRWTFNPEQPSEQPARGLSYWTDGKTSILFAGGVSYLYALDPETGKPLLGFGDGGRVDLRRGLADPGVDYKQTFAAMTSPGVIYKDLIIVGFRLPETEPSLRGDIRAFDVHTGALRWTFHTIPHPGEPGYETWMPNSWKTSGSANNWAGMAVDEKRGIVYVPTGSAVNDFYGFDRLGDDLYADTMLALDANTGQRLWHFQEVHHDIWDRDFPSPPALITVHSHGKTVDAVAETTKQGFLYLFDRVTGKPLFPVKEEPFPPSTVPGEKPSTTQPIPLAPAPYARQLLTADMLTTRTPAARAWASEQFKGFISNGLFVPLSLDKQTVVFPGFDGGAEWGGPAVDPHTGVIYINANDIAWTGGLTESRASGSPGANLYQNQCSACHGVNLAGAPPNFPTLIKITDRLSDAAILTVVHDGKGRMPSFPNVNGASETELISYLKNPDTEASPGIVRPVGPNRAELAGAKVYEHNCAICHGDDMLGAPSNYPGLIGARQRLGDKQLLEIIHGGKGRMPAFTKLSDADSAALLRFLGFSAAPLVEDTVAAGNSTKREVESALASPGGEARYRFTGYRRFLDPDGYPAIQPPWGTLNAIDLNTGKYLWKIPLGEYPELAAKGIKSTGSENYGGPLVTAGGVVIIAATNFDRKIRAFNSSTGQLLWSTELPYAGNATPATYMIDGKQYIVIATSGARDTKGPQGAAYVAFALP
jgi:glucose dehydrogenase